MLLAPPFVFVSVENDVRHLAGQAPRARGEGGDPADGDKRHGDEQGDRHPPAHRL